MSVLDRRGFIGGTALGVTALSGCVRANRVSRLDAGGVNIITAAVLPDALGLDGAARIARDFLEWASGYDAGAELNHGYGSGEITHAGDDPVPAWAAQITELDGRAREQFGTALRGLAVADCRPLIRQALASYGSDRLPLPQRAEHVALAVMAYFYRTSEATDLAYRASIRKQQCRPLDDAPNEPVALM